MNLVVKEVLSKINQNGYKAYLVGGYPRDYYLGKKTDDYDICTNAQVEQLQDWFMVLKTNYMSSIIIEKGIKMEITPFRKEGAYCNHRFPIEIETVSDLETDLLRRDFVMNTLCMDQNEMYVDLLGARKDIDEKIVRSVGNPMKKLEQDALRILRAIRFATVYNFTIEEELSNAIMQLRNLVSNLSYFRKRQELNRMILSENRCYGFSLLKKYHLEKELELEQIDLVTKDMSFLEVWYTIDPKQKYEYTKEEKRKLKEFN